MICGLVICVFVLFIGIYVVDGVFWFDSWFWLEGVGVVNLMDVFLISGCFFLFWNVLWGRVCLIGGGVFVKGLLCLMLFLILGVCGGKFIVMMGGFWFMIFFGGSVGWIMFLVIWGVEDGNCGGVCVIFCMFFMFVVFLVVEVIVGMGIVRGLIMVILLEFVIVFVVVGFLFWVFKFIWVFVVLYMILKID